MVLNNLLGVLGIVGAVFSTPWGQVWTSRYMRWAKQKRALARLKAIPEYQIGAYLDFYSADVGGGSARVGTSPWVLADMDVGRVLLEDAWGRTLPMTCAEFEAGSAVMITATEYRQRTVRAQQEVG